MTVKSEIDYQCPQCQAKWIPFAAGLSCPACGRAVPDGEVAAVLSEAIESARFNKRLYGKIEVEYWVIRRLGDRYLQWGFKALQMAEGKADVPATQIAIGALMDLDLEEFTPYRSHVLQFLAALVEKYRGDVKTRPQEWEKMPEPEKPFFGRKIIDDQAQ